MSVGRWCAGLDLFSSGLFYFSFSLSDLHRIFLSFHRLFFVYSIKEEHFTRTVSHVHEAQRLLHVILLDEKMFTEIFNILNTKE